MPLAFTPSPDLYAVPALSAAFQRGQTQIVLLSGKNTAAPTASLGDIWAYPAIAAGQQVRVNPSAGFSLAVVSDNVNDVNTSGTGAWLVGVSYLDTRYNPHTAVFAMNGQTAVTSATSIDGGAGGAVANVLRINGTEVLTTGTGLANAGNLFVTDSTNTYAAGVPVTTSKVYDCVLAGDNVDSSSHYTIPLGYQGMVVWLLPGINDVTATAKFGKVRLAATTGANGIYLSFDIGGLSSNNNPVPLGLPCFPVLPEKTDMRIQAQVSAATEVSCINFLVIWPKLV